MSGKTCSPQRQRTSWALLLVLVVLVVLLGYFFTVAQQNDAARRAALERAKAWQQIVEDTAAAIIVVDGEGIIVQWNRGAQRLLGWSETTAVGSKCDLILPPKEERKENCCLKDPKVRAELDSGKIVLIDSYVVDSEGHVHNVHVRLSIVPDEGRTLYVAQIVQMDKIDVMAEVPPPARGAYAPPRPDKFRVQEPPDYMQQKR